MNEKQLTKLRISLLISVILFQVCHLAWEHYNGGVITHHLFMRADLPGISNWWGLVILPVLVWFSVHHVSKRIPLNVDDTPTTTALPRPIFVGFFGMLLISSIQSIAFVNGFPNITMYLALGVIISALFLPLYRMECILGHVIGSTFVFGPAIPFVGVLMFAPISLLSDKCIKPLLVQVKMRMKTE